MISLYILQTLINNIFDFFELKKFLSIKYKINFLYILLIIVFWKVVDFERMTSQFQFILLRKIERLTQKYV